MNRRTRWSLIEGEPGCAYAVENECVAIVVDALRASATAAMMLDSGAVEIITVREVEEAIALKRDYPDALLFGERGGLPPKGFDFGNSPRDVKAVRGRRAIFTTTTGAGRLVSCWGCPAVFMGSTINAKAVVEAAFAQERDVVLIPAGLATDPMFNAQEDWAAATAIARCAIERADRAGMIFELVEGDASFLQWSKRIEDEGLLRLFESAPHSAKLRKVGLDDDIPFCAQMNITNTVPEAFQRVGNAVALRRFTVTT